MKTWNDLCKEKSQVSTPISIIINRKDFDAIQLDAYKAGLTKGAQIAANMQDSEYTAGGLIHKAIKHHRDTVKEIEL